MDTVLFFARFTTVHYHCRHKGQRNQHCAKSFPSEFMILVLTILPTIAMSAPVATQEPHWINPCDLPDPFEDFNNPPPIPPRELLKQVVETSNIAKKHARAVKDEFVREKFQDASFDVDYMRQEWLPEVPRATFNHFKSMNASEAYKKSYEYMQFYAVGIEEMKFDQILYPESDGGFKDEFQNLQNHARPVLCRLHLGIIVMKIKQNPDVMRK
ncbi:uncharacterized protein LOC111089712, partial [Limulus polyphemus]|uniref:Uncharacterized protein LOC111089712 n=1 Tax=Limulus polyphemus TaxID=6850 RepID=A0ABM1TR89_LIMPO